MLQKQVAQTKFFEHGGTYVINPGTSLDGAVFVYHPTARGKRVLEAYPQARPFFEALAESPDGFVRDAAAVLHAADMACYEAQCAGRNRVHLGAVRVRA